MARCAVVVVLVSVLLLGGEGRAGCCTAIIASGPQWLAGGDRLLYWFDGPAIRSTVTNDLTGKAERIVLQETSRTVLSPDATRVAGIATAQSGATTLVVARVDGRDRRAIGAAARAAPAWSPGGGTLVYAPRDGQLALLDVASGGSRPLGAGAGPSWSPDGARLAVASGDPSAIWIVDLDGTRRQLVPAGTAPRWSPAGGWIAFEHAEGLWLVRPDGTGAHELRSHTTDAAWAPDGSRLAAVFTDRGDLAGGDFAVLKDIGELGVVDADGAARPLGVLAGDQRPAWSPDGRWIAFAANNGNGHGLDVVAAAGGGVRHIAYACAPPSPPPLTGCSYFGGYSVPASSLSRPVTIRVRNAGARKQDPPALQIAVRDRRDFRVRAATVTVTVRGAPGVRARPARAETSYPGVLVISLVGRRRLPPTLRLVVDVNGGGRAVFGCKALHVAPDRGCR
jgi:Tol biopolymer transport system component